MTDLDRLIIGIPRIGPTTARHLKDVGITTWRDALYYYPFRYEDYSHKKQLADIRADEYVIAVGTLELLNAKTSKFRRLKLTEAMLSDESGSIKVIWFNMPFVAKTLQVGMQLMITGKAINNYGLIELHNPQFQVLKNTSEIRGGLVPVYHASSGLSQKSIRVAVEGVLTRLRDMSDWLPDSLKKKYLLIELLPALRGVHVPETHEDLRVSQRRLKFDELFLIVLRSALIKRYMQQSAAASISFHEEEIKKFVSSLLFTLTDDQRRSAWAILKDLERPLPMNRLLEGDVGSGKTVVAAIALLNTALSGFQGVFMAPTEVLSKQHYASLRQLFNDFKDIPIALLTSSTAELNGDPVKKDWLVAEIKAGKVAIIIGTHAVMTEKLLYRNLGLVVIDEQHRFGVEQRKALKAKNLSESVPHFLSMTATPIPRTLSLILYGELDISVLKQMPQGRKPIQTSVVTKRQKPASYEFIRKQVGEGRQVFVICPLIDESDVLGATSVRQEYQKLSTKIFPDLNVAMLHGKMKGEEKDQIMMDFKNKKSDILVSTTVIEVGVDVPNATVMMIEGAERFGLSQLHQLRGRVGRSDHQSYCFVFTSEDIEAREIDRLSYLERTNDGFALAEFDLKERGPGEIYGSRQSGLPDLKIAELTDVALLSMAKEAAEWFLDTQRLDDHPEFKKKVEEKAAQTHFE